MNIKTTMACGLALAIAVTLAAPALATTIGFEGAPFGPNFTGPVTESGYIYSLYSGGVYINAVGNPGHDVEGQEVSGGGALNIVAAGGGAFNFGGLDFSVFGNGDMHAISLNGYRHGFFVGGATYSATSSIFGNWASYGPSTLAGVTLDQLVFVLPASTASFYSTNIDNVVLNAAGGVPEPASWAMLIAGFGLVGVGQRRRRVLPSVAA